MYQLKNRKAYIKLVYITKPTIKLDNCYLSQKRQTQIQTHVQHKVK